MRSALGGSFHVYARLLFAEAEWPVELGGGETDAFLAVTVILHTNAKISATRCKVFASVLLGMSCRLQGDTQDGQQRAQYRLPVSHGQFGMT